MIGQKNEVIEIFKVASKQFRDDGCFLVQFLAGVCKIIFRKISVELNVVIFWIINFLFEPIYLSQQLLSFSLLKNTGFPRYSR
jgi:hypothetical protein